MAPPPTRALLIDLSGTIQIGAHATPGAASAIERLRAAHIPFRFCSNTSNESTHALLERLHNLGIDVRDGELWTSLRAVGAALRSRQCSRPFIVATEPAKQEILASIGAPPPAPHEIPPSIGAPAPTDTPHADYDAVVLAYAPAHYDFHTLNTAFRVLMHELPAQADTAHAPPLPLLATHASRYVQAADGRLSLGPGPFVAALEMGAGVRAQVVGKPERAFFEMALRSFEFAPGAEEGRIVMVGDDVRGDLGGGAAECGLWRVLVKTGKYRRGDEAREGVLPPDEVCDSFADFVNKLLEG